MATLWLFLKWIFGEISLFMKKEKFRFKPEKELRETKKISMYRKKYPKNKAFDLDDYDSYEDMLEYTRLMDKNS